MEEGISLQFLCKKYFFSCKALISFEFYETKNPTQDKEFQISANCLAHNLWKFIRFADKEKII
jgi:hypothetical protein